MVRGETPNSNTGVTNKNPSNSYPVTTPAFQLKNLNIKNRLIWYIPLFDGILCLSVAVFRVDFLKSKTRI